MRGLELRASLGYYSFIFAFISKGLTIQRPLGWPQTQHEDQPGLELLKLCLPLPFNCWDKVWWDIPSYLLFWCCKQYALIMHLVRFSRVSPHMHIALYILNPVFSTSPQPCAVLNLYYSLLHFSVGDLKLPSAEQVFPCVWLTSFNTLSFSSTHFAENAWILFCIVAE